MCASWPPLGSGFRALQMPLPEEASPTPAKQPDLAWRDIKGLTIECTAPCSVSVASTTRQVVSRGTPMCQAGMSMGQQIKLGSRAAESPGSESVLRAARSIRSMTAGGKVQCGQPTWRPLINVLPIKTQAGRPNNHVYFVTAPIIAY